MPPKLLESGSNPTVPKSQNKFFKNLEFFFVMASTMFLSGCDSGVDLHGNAQRYSKYELTNKLTPKERGYYKIGDVYNNGRNEIIGKKFVKNP
jgi:hypothetical protein